VIRQLVILTIGIAIAGCGGRADVRVAADLVQLLPQADVRTEVAAIELGTPAARSHLGAGWSYDEDSFVWGLSRSSTVRLFLLEQRHLELVLECRPFNPLPGRPQTVTPVVNGSAAARVELGADWAEYRVHLPAAMLREGDNRLELRYAYSERPADVRPGSRDKRPLAVAWRSLRFETAHETGAARALQDGGRPTLALDRGCRLDYFLRVAPGSRIVFDDLAGGPAPNSSSSPLLRVRVEYADGTPADEALWTAGSGALDLDNPRPALARVSLQVPAASSGVDMVQFVAPLVLEPAIVEQPTRPFAPQHSPAPSRPNVVVYLIDALRADHLGVYGYQRPTSPEIDAFAAEAVVFTHAMANASWTRPAVASLFTGVSPLVHGAIGRQDSLGDSLPTLAELLGQAGYQTAGFITNSNVSTPFGLGRGFDTYQVLPETRSREIHQLSSRLNQPVLRWLESRDPARPFFLYLHASDPHGPYTPPEPFRTRFAAGLLEPVMNSLDHRESLIANYDAEIAHNDHHFGRLMTFLEQSGLYGNTLVVLTADHGEAFFEHRQWQHGRSLHAEELHIPLILKLPDGTGVVSGRTCDTLCQQVDLLPTILQAAGLEPLDHVHGRSLIDLLGDQGRSSEGRSVLAHLDLDGCSAEALLLGDLKLVHTLASPELRPGLALYNLAEDPDEQRSILDQRPIEAGYLRQQLRTVASSWQRAGDTPQVKLPPEQQEILRLLGYLGS